MELAPDITSDDLKVFLEEAEEQLDLLDKDIIRLEKEGDNSDLLQEIFRAAHTLKGSSAMLGHNRMAELAHAMESLLDKVRKGALSPTSDVIDALLRSLDGLATLKEELVTSEESSINIDSLVDDLNAAMDSDYTNNEDKASQALELILSSEDTGKVQSALLDGKQAYHIKVNLDKSSSWTAVRCFQILTELSGESEIVRSIPSLKEIEEHEDKVGFILEMVVCSAAEDSKLHDVIVRVSDVESCDIKPWTMEETEPGNADKNAATEDDTKADRSSSAQNLQAQKHQTVRIDVDRLDSMMNMIGELVITTSRIFQIGKTLEIKYHDDDMVHELGISTTQTTKVLNELQEDIMRVRMLPVGTVFNTFPRMIRDLAQKSRKKIDFIVEGEQTGIDRTVIEHIRDPLLHLLRNAVDHGIETSEERKLAGKTETATLKLSAFHKEGHVFLTVEDDGRGIDTKRLRSSAVNKGFTSAEDAYRMSDEDALDLIFSSGLSTKEQATEVSGRGVGLDIVKKNIEALNGYVNVETKVGIGTKFTLRLPLTLATLDSLLVTCNHNLLALPVVNVIEAVRLDSTDISTIRGNRVIQFRGGILPLVNLNEHFCLSEADTTDSVYIIIVRAGDKQLALGVDSLVGKQEIVAKALGDQIGDIKGISGASILGDGRVALIIDVPTLISTVLEQQAAYV